jgi:enoyl-CoA hydratase/carnithine racemase
MAVIRHQVYADLDNDFPTARAQSLDFMRRYSRGGDFGEGVASFNERRPPRFAPLPPAFAVTLGDD